MIEQSAQLVQIQAKAVKTIPPSTKDGARTHEALNTRNTTNNKKSDHASEKNGFVIQKHFTPSSLEAARTLGSFQKVLDYLEQTPEQHQINNAKQQDHAPLLPEQHHQIFPTDKAKEASLPKENQLEFDIFPKEEKTPKHPPLEIKKLDSDVPNSKATPEDPDIKIGNNPTDFKIHKLITDEIIKAISHSSKDLQVRPLNEPVAAKLANHVRKALAQQHHAITTQDQSTPIKVLDKTL